MAFALIVGFVWPAISQSADPDKALAEVQKTPMSKGPNGETPSPASSVTLTPDELAKIKELKAKAAIVMHYAGNDWALAQVAGLKEQFGKMGIEVISVTDAGFKPEKQVADIETILAQKPQIIVSIPTIRFLPRPPTRRPLMRVSSWSSWIMFRRDSRPARIM